MFTHARSFLSLFVSLSAQTLIPGYENTAIWTLSNLQLLALAHVFAVSRPFRAPQWSNVPFTIVWCAFSTGKTGGCLRF